MRSDAPRLRASKENPLSISQRKRWVKNSTVRIIVLSNYCPRKKKHTRFARQLTNVVMVLYFFFGCCYSENHFAKSSYELNNYRAARDFIIFSSANSNPQAIYAIIRFPWNCIVHGLKRSCGFIFYILHSSFDF